MIKSLKSLCITLCTALSLYASPALAAGTTPLAMAQQIDFNGQPIAGCLLNFYVAGTVATPQNAFADFGLTTPLPNPIQCDQSGRVPQHWLADGLIHIRLTDSSGGPIIDTTMQVLGPSSGGGGGGGTVDPTSIMSTGDIKVKYGTGPLSGFVRCNSLTIGSAVSGATERANADTQALFIYLYNTDPNLTVSGGRSGNALNDFNSNKTITTPDWRGRAIGALADMGNSASGVLQTAYFGSNPTVLGAIGGNQASVLGPTNLPAHTHSGTTGNENVGHTHNGTASGTTGNDSPDHTHALPTFAQQNGVSYAPNPGAVVGATNITGQSTAGASARHQHSFSAAFTTAGENQSHQHAFTTDNGPGSSVPFPSVGPMMLATIYMKL